jgi:ornithine cyclodeaminase
MPVRILNQTEVEALLPMADCIAAMEAAFRTLSAGGAALPLRTVLRLPDGRSVFGVMPARLADPPALGLKAISVFPGNEGTPLDSHQGVVVLFEPATGAPAAILDASSITAIRTAAVSGVATRALARPEAGDLAILGSGVQARTHLDAMRAVRPLRRVRAWSRTAAHLTAFVRWARAERGVEVEAMPDPQATVAGADLVCTVTGSPAPVLAGEWLAEGTHVNAVGASVPAARELDSRAVARGRLYADRVESAQHEAGDYLIPLAEGAIAPEHLLGELGDLLTGKLAGRSSPAEITIFKSLGLAIEDLAAATLVLRQAEARGIGLVTELGGRRH